MGYVIAWLDKEIQRAKDALDARADGIGMRWYKFLCRGGLLLVAVYAALQAVLLLTGMSYRVYGLDPAVVYGDYGLPLRILDQATGALAALVSLLALLGWHGLLGYRRFVPSVLAFVFFGGTIVALFYVAGLTCISYNPFWLIVYGWLIVLFGSLGAANWQYFQRRKAMFDQRGAASCD